MKTVQLRYGPWHREQARLSSRCLCGPAANDPSAHDPNNKNCRYSPHFKDNFEEHAVDSVVVEAGGAELYIALDYEADETAFFIVKWAVRPLGSRGAFSTGSHGCSETFLDECRFFIPNDAGEPIVEVFAGFDPEAGKTV